MKYLSVFLSFIIISIIILSACCLVTGSTFEYDHSGPCIGSCMAAEDTAHLAKLNYSDFNKLLFVFTLSLVLTIISLNYSYSFNRKQKQNDFKILFHIDKHIQAGLLHPKIY